MCAGEHPNPTAPLNKSKSARRRRSLTRGFRLWNEDRTLCAERTRRAALVTLTVPEAEPEAALGLARDFWARVRRTWLGTRYFCWLELQGRGAVHYHAIWLNPPHRRLVDLQAWVDRAWGHGRTQVRFRNAQWVNQDAGDYMQKYARKIGGKRYQQYYEDLPRELRTFMNQRLEIPPDELEHRLDREDWRYIGESVREGELVEPHLVLLGDLRHEVPPGGRCTALDHRRPRRSVRWDLPPPLKEGLRDRG
jgi:hypothetical protein